MTGQIECRCYGRAFTIEEMALLRALIAGPAQFTRHALSKEFCRRIGWVRRFVLGPFCQTLTNLSPKKTANCVLASNHSRGGRFHASAA